MILKINLKHLGVFNPFHTGNADVVHVVNRSFVLIHLVKRLCPQTSHIISKSVWNIPWMRENVPSDLFLVWLINSSKWVWSGVERPYFDMTNKPEHWGSWIHATVSPKLLIRSKCVCRVKFQFILGDIHHTVSFEGHRAFPRLACWKGYDVIWTV